MKVQKTKLLTIIGGISLALIGIILSYTYRVYIYENSIYDFHLADTIGSLICVPSSTLLFWGLYEKYTFKKLIVLNTIGFIIYELLTLLPYHGTFGYYDIIAIFIGSSFSILCWKIFKLIH